MLSCISTLKDIPLEALMIFFKFFINHDKKICLLLKYKNKKNTNKT